MMSEFKNKCGQNKRNGSTYFQLMMKMLLLNIIVCLKKSKNKLFILPKTISMALNSTNIAKNKVSF